MSTSPYVVEGNKTSNELTSRNLKKRDKRWDKKRTHTHTERKGDAVVVNRTRSCITSRILHRTLAKHSTAAQHFTGSREGGEPLATFSAATCLTEGSSPHISTQVPNDVAIPFVRFQSYVAVCPADGRIDIGHRRARTIFLIIYLFWVIRPRAQVRLGIPPANFLCTSTRA